MIRRLQTDLAAVCSLFTRLPAGWLMPRDPCIDMAGGVWAFPFVGALVGLCGGLVYAAGVWLGLPSPLSGCWSVAAMLLLTGALHEDGLADMVDGFGGGRDTASKLAIMRDSRIGSYGALALLLSTLVRISALAALGTPSRVLAALVVSGALSRAAIVLVLVLAPPARKDGLASALQPVSRLSSLVAFAAAVASSFLLLPGRAAMIACAGAALVGLVLVRLTRGQVGGHTGDVLGACSVLADCVVLSGMCAQYGLPVGR